MTVAFPFNDTLVQRARALETAVREAADALAPDLCCLTEPYVEAVRISAERLVPKVWSWSVEPCYGGKAVFFITGYRGE